MMNLDRYILAADGRNGPRGGIAVVGPFDRKTIAVVKETSAEEVERALARSYALYRDRGSWLPLSRRIEILDRAATLIRSRIEILAVEAAREGGKPLVDSRVEIARAAESVRSAVDHLRTHHGDVVPMGLGASSANRMAFTQFEPIGVVIAVSAFNHPFNLIAHQVAPAVAAGCPVIVKPARTTPLSCLRFVEILREAGLPEEWCVPILPTDHAVTSKLTSDARVGFVSFIGSAEVGWKLRAGLAPGARCALEHGGVAPVVIAEDADLASCVAPLAKGAFYHAGQVCVSVQKIFVDAKRAEDFANALAKAGDAMRVGDATLVETEVGPMITPREAARVDAWVEEAIAGGARCLNTRRRISETCYAPTVLLDPPANAKVSTQEVFGPVACVYSCDDLDDAIARANSLPVSFQASVFTRSIDTAVRCYERLDASAVMVNDHTAFRVDWMPFAGLRVSGHGVGGISHTLDEMRVKKMMVIKSPAIIR